MPAAVPHLSSASLSSQGYVRPNNEDRVHCDDARGIYIVVDGMGGHAAGEQAASVAIERLRARLERPTDSPELRLREAITLANNAIYEAAQTKPAWAGMACVLTAALVEDGQVTVGHVGDSRLYKLRRNAIQKITRDHSPVGEREDAGELSENEAMQHPRRNEVYRDVGSGAHSPDDPDFIDIFHFEFEPDSALLLCSDGLSDALSSEQILQTVAANARTPASVVRTLVANATRVGHDNVSAIFIEGGAFAKAIKGVRTAPVPDEEPEAEQTDRLSVAPLGGSQRKWYANGPAYFAYGTTLGLLVALAAIQFLWHPYGSHQPRTILVTAPATISDALASTNTGDTLLLGPGSYAEVVHLKEGVNLVSRHRRQAVIEGSIIAENGVHSRVEGIRLRAADLGVVVQDSDVTLVDDEISGAHDVGVEFLGSSHGVVTACHIHDNAGAGLSVLDTAEASILNSVITANGTAPGRPRPGLLLRSTATPLVSGNIFAGNGAEAVWLPREDPSLLQKNAFSFGPNGDRRPAIHLLKREDSQP